MLKISLGALAIFASTLAAFPQTKGDSVAYTTRKLKAEEVNFVTSYYHQDGNNSAVTGGIGSEKLSDFATTLEVKMSRYDRWKRKHTLTGELGIDVYTSASSDKIDPNTVSSASSGDKRIYPSLSYAINNEQKGSSVSLTGSVSSEFDYFSKGLAAGWTQSSKDGNRELTLKGQVFLDTWKVILPVELRASSDISGSKPRNSYSFSATVSQVINRRLQLLVLADIAYQTGQLATLYHRTYFNDGSHGIEHLPDTRIKVPLGIRLNYFAGDRIILRSYYRYYKDSWGLSAHTAELEVPVKATPFLSLTPFVRYYSQAGVRYFKAYEKHAPGETYYTSDYDLSALTSTMTGMGIRLAPPGGVMGISKFNALEIRYGHYNRSTGLTANIITLFARFK